MEMTKHGLNRGRNGREEALQKPRKHFLTKTGMLPFEYFLSQSTNLSFYPTQTRISTKLKQNTDGRNQNKHTSALVDKEKCLKVRKFLTKHNPNNV
jgi:hypothetical protein